MKYKEFLSEAIKNGLCEEYRGILYNTKKNYALFKLLCSAKGLDYMCDAIAKNWGVTNDEIYSRLGDWINGKEVVLFKEGYNSKLYCAYKGDVIADTTMVGIINCERATIEIPKNHICEIYLTGKCTIRLTGEGRCVCVCYGKEENIKIQNYCSNYKRINKKKADNYE